MATSASHNVRLRISQCLNPALRYLLLYLHVSDNVYSYTSAIHQPIKHVHFTGVNINNE